MITITRFVLILCVALSVQIRMSADGRTASARMIQSNGSDAQQLARLESALDSLRQQLKIPALSAAVIKNQRVIWAKGLGYSDLENKVPATEHTAYHLASLTKTFASTILMQLVQQGKVKLDDPVAKYGIALDGEGLIQVKHLLSHTSEGNPGERYRYNGGRFAELDKVVQKAVGKSFADLLIANILDPNGLSETAPNVPPAFRTKSPDGADPKAEGEVKQALMNLIGGFNAGKVEQVEHYVTPQLNAFRRNQGLLTSFSDLADLRNQFRSGVTVNIQVLEPEAAVYGDSAITTFLASVVITLPDRSVRNEGPWRASYFWNKQSGAWKLVHAHESPLNTSPISAGHQKRFDSVTKILAQPYQLDSQFNPVKGSYPTHFSVSAGLMSTVLDMAKYDIAIDQNKFLNKETQQLAFTPMISTKGESLPYGLGWFTQSYKARKLIWHYGYWQCNSSLIVKVPERDMTFIAMANTDNLSRPTDLGAGDVTSSPVGLAFLKIFVLPEIFGSELPDLNWDAPETDLTARLKETSDKPFADVYKKELLVQTRMYSSVGRPADAARLFKVYGKLYSSALPEDLRRRPLAEISRVPDNANQTAEFSISKKMPVRVFAIGEALNGAMVDYGLIEEAQTGRVVWEMKEPETTHAGGANKNRKIDVVVTLAPGKYRLRYKTDDSHAFDNWNSFPPDLNFWGIAVFAKE